MLDDTLNYFASSKLLSDVQSIVHPNWQLPLEVLPLIFLYIYNLFAPSLTPPTAVRCPQAAVILEF